MTKHLIILLSCLPLLCNAQLKVSGKTVHYKTQKKLPLTQINVIDIHSNDQYSVVLAKGSYKIKLDRGKVYRLEYTKEGYYSKFVKVDARGIPADKSTSMFIDMDMVAIELAIDASFFKEPMGKCAYKPDLNIMAWDVDYSKLTFEKLNTEFERIAGKQPRATLDETTVKINNQAQYGGTVLGHNNPFKLVHFMSQDVVAANVSERNLSGEFKKIVHLGMQFGQLATESHQDNLDAKIALIRMIEKNVQALLKTNFSSRNFQLRLANQMGNQDSVQQILYDLFSTVYDKVKIKSNGGYLLSQGGFIEVLSNAVQAYEKKPTAQLNAFIGDCGQEARNYVVMKPKNLSDPEESFEADFDAFMRKLTLVKTAPIKEQLQDDPNHVNFKYNITPNQLNDIQSTLKGIRSNFL